MTPRERFTAALDRRPIQGLVPHFELVFFLTMETFGRIHPSHRNYQQWDQMSERERELHRRDMADIFMRTAEEFDHDAILLHPNPGTVAETIRLIRIIRERSGNRWFLMVHGDATFGIPDGEHMVAFACRLHDEPATVKKEAAAMVDDAFRRAEMLQQAGGLDGFALCSDYCLDSGPFLSPSMCAEFITPYLARLIEGYRSMGFRTVKHTDGNIMPILDQLLQTQPDALHSLDPQAGVDIATVKQIAGSQVCLIGNVNCGLLQTGTDEEVAASARYALRHGMPGYGYVFSTSNCIYTGMPLERYHLILNIRRQEGIYR